MIIKYRRQGKSIEGKHICETIYQEGQKELVKAGFERPVSPCNEGIFHITAKEGRKTVGVISWFVADEYKDPQAIVMMAYVRKPWRGKRVFTNLHRHLTMVLKLEGIKTICYSVCARNRVMRTAQKKLGGEVECITYLYDL